MDAVTVLDRRLQRLEHHDGHSAAEDGAIGSHIERAAVARRRNHRSRLVPVTGVVRDSNRHTAREGHVAFTAQQALACQVDSDERRRARRLHRDARSPQIELMRNPGSQVVLVVPERHVDEIERRSLPHDRARIMVREKVVQHVDARGSGSVHTDRAIEPGGVAAGVFQGMPRALQEQPLLRIHHPRRLRREAEELRVEFVDSVDERCAPDIRRTCQGFFADASSAELVLRQRDDRLLAAPEIVPELRQRIGSREPACHADDRNGIGRQQLRCQLRFVHACCPLFRRIAAPRRAAARWLARSRTSLTDAVLLCTDYSELADNIRRDVAHRCATQQKRHRWLDAQIRLAGLPHPHCHKGIHAELNHRRDQIESRLIGVSHDRRDARAQAVGDDPLRINRVQIFQPLYPHPIVVIGQVEFVRVGGHQVVD